MKYVWASWERKIGEPLLTGESLKGSRNTGEAVVSVSTSVIRWSPPHSTYSMQYKVFNTSVCRY